MKVKPIFVDITNNTSKWLQARKGSEFEDIFEDKCKELGFTRKLKDSIKDKYEQEFQTIKKLIHDNYDTKPISNILNHDKSMVDIFVWQPFGTQDYPDFMIFTKKYIIPVEIKYSSDTATSPMWNGNLPKANGIYVFGNNKKQDIVLFKGIDMLPNDERKKLIGFWDEVREKYQSHKQITKQEIKENKLKFEYGFDVYIRKTFQQNKQINEQATTDLFKNKNKQKLHKLLFDYLTKVDDEKA